MKIAIDVSQINRDGAGINNYTIGILKEFAKNTSHQFYLCMRVDEALPFELPEHFHKLIVPSVPKYLGGGLMWYFFLGQRLRKMQIEQLLSMSLSSAALFFPTTVIIHDLSPITHPQTFTWSLKLRFSLALNITRMFADNILCVTQTTKREFIQQFPKFKQDIAVTSEGLAEWTRVPKNSQREQEVKQKYQLPENFLFSLGTIQPRKNYVRAIQAFAELVKADSGEKVPARRSSESAVLCTDLHYIIGGGKGWMYDEILAEVKRLGVEDRVKFLGFIDEADLPFIFDQAKAFAQLSVDEGFGLPIIEARARGLSLLLSEIPIFKELKLDIEPVWVDPLSVESIKQGMLQVIATEKTVGDTSNVGAAGTGRDLSLLQQHYSWSTAAAQVLSAIM